jgi:hypothetical protein
MDRVHAPVDRERRRPTLDHGHFPGGGSLEIGRNGVPVRGGEQSTEETLGEGELWIRKHAIEGEVSVVMAGGCTSSFYSGWGRAHWGGGGGNGRR